MTDTIGGHSVFTPTPAARLIARDITPEYENPCSGRPSERQVKHWIRELRGLGGLLGVQSGLT